ncbi:hypothetical protein MXD81_26055, partial [Microbacteriaceae bacterium K1510]|nr:hypothetical protein [Microbacteriaceae bacterium K1510]
MAFILGHAEVSACFVSPEFLSTADQALRQSGCNPSLLSIISRPAVQDRDWVPFREMIQHSNPTEPDVDLADDD